MILLQIRARQLYLESKLAQRAQRHPSVADPVAMAIDAARNISAPVLPTAGNHGHHAYASHASSQSSPRLASPSTEEPNEQMLRAAASARREQDQIRAAAVTRTPSPEVPSPVVGAVENEGDLSRTPSLAPDGAKSLIKLAITSNETQSIAVASAQQSAGGKATTPDVAPIVGISTAIAQSRSCNKAREQMTKETVGATIESEANRHEVNAKSAPTTGLGEISPMQVEAEKSGSGAGVDHEPGISVTIKSTKAGEQLTQESVGATVESEADRHEVNAKSAPTTGLEEISPMGVEAEKSGSGVDHEPDAFATLSQDMNAAKPEKPPVVKVIDTCAATMAARRPFQEISFVMVIDCCYIYENSFLDR